MKERLLRGDMDTQVAEVKGDGFSQTTISQKADSPDPRVGGTKIIFDTRLANITQSSETSQIDAFMKVKAEQKASKENKLTSER